MITGQLSRTNESWQEYCMPSPVIRRLRIDIIRPTTEQMVDNLPSGNILRQNVLNKELDTKIKPIIAPKL